MSGGEPHSPAANSVFESIEILQILQIHQKKSIDTMSEDQSNQSLIVSAEFPANDSASLINGSDLGPCILKQLSEPMRFSYIVCIYPWPVAFISFAYSIQPSREARNVICWYAKSRASLGYTVMSRDTNIVPWRGIVERMLLMSGLLLPFFAVLFAVFSAMFSAIFSAFFSALHYSCSCFCSYSGG